MTHGDHFLDKKLSELTPIATLPDDSLLYLVTATGDDSSVTGLIIKSAAGVGVFVPLDGTDAMTGVLQSPGLLLNNATNPPYQEGLIFYDNDKKAISYYNDESDTTINEGLELLIRVINNSGVTITNGMAVRVEGSASGLPQIVRAIATSANNAIASGIATHDILDGQAGFITRLGTIGGLDTSAFVAGDVAFLSDTVLGGFTPTAPRILTALGIILVADPTEGVMIGGPQPVATPVAMGQAKNLGSHSMSLTTTPQPLEGFVTTPLFEENTTITTTASGGSFRAQIAPLAAPYSGFYQTNALVEMVNVSGTPIVFLEVYIGITPTGIRARLDLSNNQIDDGTLSIPGAFIEQVINETDFLELYVYLSSGTADVDIENILFNINRLGIT